MSELRKANTSHPYFVTLTVVDWIDIFTRSHYSDIIIDSLRYCQKMKELKIFAYVIMSNHVHLILQDLNENLPNTLRDFKSFTAKKILQAIENNLSESRKQWLLNQFQYHANFKNQNSKHMLWQKTSFPIVLDQPSIFDQKIEYIHNNPVTTGYVNSPEYWNYSSASSLRLIDLDEH